MRKQIVVSFQFEGIHYWPEAKNYLKNPHRHLFKGRAWKDVLHNNRDIEFITLKNNIEFYFRSHGADFENKSCEDIAEMILKEFELSQCEILEDGENGAVVSI
jgi:hypothetical protein